MERNFETTRSEFGWNTRGMMFERLLSNILVARAERLGAILLGVVLMSACGSVPKTHYYSVTMPAATPAADSQSTMVLDMARFQAATGQLESHGRLRTVKKDIARIYTVVRERELGIRTAPGSSNEDGAA